MKLRQLAISLEENKRVLNSYIISILFCGRSGQFLTDEEESWGKINVVI